MKQQLTRDQWLAEVRSLISPVGECMEWQGSYAGKTPLVYVPRNYAWEGNTQSRQSTRSVLFSLSHGHRLSASSLIRMRCHNYRCVHEDHFCVIPRTHQAKEQGKRGEFSTAKRRAATAKTSRAKAKLTAEIAEQIRLSPDSGPVEAAKHGVSPQTVTAIRRGVLWAETARGASVFSWRPA